MHLMLKYILAYILLCKMFSTIEIKNTKFILVKQIFNAYVSFCKQKTRKHRVESKKVKQIQNFIKNLWDYLGTVFTQLC